MFLVPSPIPCTHFIISSHGVPQTPPPPPPHPKLAQNENPIFLGRDRGRSGLRGELLVWSNPVKLQVLRSDDTDDPAQKEHSEHQVSTTGRVQVKIFLVCTHSLATAETWSTTVPWGRVGERWGVVGGGIGLESHTVHPHLIREHTLVESDTTLRIFYLQNICLSSFILYQLFQLPHGTTPGSVQDNFQAFYSEMLYGHSL